MATTYEQRTDYQQVSGVLTSYADFQELVNSLNTRGYRQEDLSVLMSENTHNLYFSPKEGNKAPEGATVGGVTGGIIGAVVGGLTLIGNVIAPGIGLFAAGPLVGAITGGAIGTATGGLVGAMIGAGVPMHEAKFYESALNEEGGILVVAHVPKDHVKEVRSVFERCNAKTIKVYS